MKYTAAWSGASAFPVQCPRARRPLIGLALLLLATGCTDEPVPSAVVAPPYLDGASPAPMGELSSADTIGGPQASLNVVGAAAASGITISTIASGGLLTQPDGIALDVTGDFIVPNVASPPSLVRVTPAGVVTTIRSGIPFLAPNAVTLDGAGNFIVTDEFSDALYRVTPSGALNPIFNGPPFEQPVGVAVDASGDFIVSDFSGALFRITPSGAISTVATGLGNISGVINDGSGNFIVVSCSGVVSRVSPSGAVTTIASGIAGCPFNAPAVAPNGDIIVTLFFSSAVVNVTPAGVVTTIYSGSPLLSPNGVVISGSDLIVSDRAAAAVFRISGALQPANQPPDANAGPAQTITGQTSPALVTLDGSGSSDPDSDPLTFSWTEDIEGTPTEIATGVNPTVSLAEGTHTITLTVTDDSDASDTDEVVIIVDATIPEGGAATLSDVDDDGNLVPVAGLSDPDGVLPEGTTVRAEFVDECHRYLIGQVGRCLDLDLLDDLGDELEQHGPVTIGLCFPNTIPLDERDNLAMFRFDDREGKVTVLRELDPQFVDCDDFVASAVDANPVMRLARGLWQGVKNFLSPKMLMAFGDRGFGGESIEESFFVWAPTLDVDGTQLHLNGAQSGQDWYTVSGTFELGPDGFDPAVDIVKVQFGDTDVETIAAGSFRGRGNSNRFHSNVPSNGSGITDMVIESDGSFTITTKNMDLAALDQDFIPFCLQIGEGARGRTQGVGLGYEAKTKGTSQGAAVH